MIYRISRPTPPPYDPFHIGQCFGYFARAGKSLSMVKLSKNGTFIVQGYRSFLSPDNVMRGPLTFVANV